VKHDLPPAHLLQLGQRVGVVARFADLLVVERGDLVGADDDATGQLGGDRGGFFTRQPQRRGAWRLAGKGRFVDVGHGHVERQL